MFYCTQALQEYEWHMKKSIWLVVCSSSFFFGFVQNEWITHNIFITSHILKMNYNFVFLCFVIGIIIYILSQTEINFFISFELSSEKKIHRNKTIRLIKYICTHLHFSQSKSCVLNSIQKHMCLKSVRFCVLLHLLYVFFYFVFFMAQPQIGIKFSVWCVLCVEMCNEFGQYNGQKSMIMHRFHY